MLMLLSGSQMVNERSCNCPHLQKNLGRSWGTRYDSLVPSDSVTSSLDDNSPGLPKPMITADAQTSGDESKHTHERVVHDASIFIGSLPSNVDHVEMMTMLSEHLSEHSEIQSIKVVRDSKGGACAFIQCQDTDSAAKLLDILRSSPPRHFMGRYLRYEPARAFRTLLISYRTPRQYKRNVRAGDIAKRTVFPYIAGDELMELELPTAMRLAKMPDTRRVTVLYNSDATGDSYDDNKETSSLLLVPLHYDAETLMKIVTVFGPVEHFGPYRLDEEAPASPGYPTAHDSPRAAIMDQGCWEVKWCHRDDCVNALMTLRRVPHLSVTWAHQSLSATSYRQPSNNAFLGNNGEAWHGSTRNSFSSNEPIRFITSSRTFSGFHLADRTSLKHAIEANPAPVSDGKGTWKQGASATTETKLQRYRPRALSLNQGLTQPSLQPTSISSSRTLPLSSWEPSPETRWTGGTRTTSSATNTGVASSVTFAAFPSASLVHKNFKAVHDDVEQDVETGIPPTPEFGASPMTPRSPGSLMLRTPTSGNYSGDLQNGSFRDFSGQGTLSPPEDKKDDTILDPTTIFVGGLEMHGPKAWDENKVRALFEKYGGVETVKVIRPVNKRSGFAFVKFNNTDSPIRAINEEHNRILDGRPIRVQLRDWQPSQRIPWRAYRSKEAMDQCSGPPTISGDDDQEHDEGAEMTKITEDTQKLKMNDIHLKQVPLSSSGETNNDWDNTKRTGKHLQHLMHSCDEAEYGQLPSPREPTSPMSPQEIGEVETTPQGPTNTSPTYNSLTPGHVPIAAYPVPTVAYYHGQGWMPSFGPPFYQPPFVPQHHAAHPFSQQPVPPFVQGSNLDAGSSQNTSSTAGPLSGPGAVYAPFVPYPIPAMSHIGSESGPGQLGTPVASSLHTQAPLMPAGFVQGDQGMLVPIYPPDALNQYMTGTRDQPSSLTPSASSTETPPPMAWRLHFPPPPVQPPSVFFQTVPGHPAFMPPGHPIGPPAWMPGQAWRTVPPQHNLQAPQNGQQFSAPFARVNLGPPAERSPHPRRHHRQSQNPKNSNNLTRTRQTRPSFSSRVISDPQTVTVTTESPRKDA